jgi:hypothetical protein
MTPEPSHVSIELNEAEQRLVCYLAKQRTTTNRAAAVHNARLGPQSDAETDHLGIGGEIAFAKLFNLYPDLSIEPRRGGADCSVGPFGVDVKTTRYPNGKLLAVATKALLAPDADVYALMIARFPRYDFCGFARRGDLLHPSRLTDLGHGPTYALEQTELLTADAIQWGVR